MSSGCQLAASALLLLSRSIGCVAALVLAACSTEPNRSSARADATAEASAPTVVEAGPLPTEPVTCGDTVCPPPAASPLVSEACCLADGTCGLTAGLVSSACHRAGGEGHLTASCPERRLAGGAILRGCCTPANTCGVRDPSGGLGCIPPLPREGGAPADRGECQFEPGADCTELADVPCDGAEDCPDGKECCGRVQQGQLDRFACLDSCASAPVTSGLWLALCHTEESCRTPGFTCSTDPEHPFLERCHPGSAADAGARGDAASADRAGVKCGEAVCPEAEVCCVRNPRAPYCAGAGEGCACAQKGTSLE